MRSKNKRSIVGPTMRTHGHELPFVPISIIVLIIPFELLALFFSWWPSLGRFTVQKKIINAISTNMHSHAHVTRK